MYLKIKNFFDQKTNIYFCLLLSMLSTLVQNGDGLFKYIYVVQILFIIFFLKIKFNLLRTFFNLGAVVIIFSFSSTIGPYQVLFCNIMILFSFDYLNHDEDKDDGNRKSIFIILSFIVFLIFLLNFLSPHTGNYLIKYKIKFNIFENSQDKRQIIYKSYAKLISKIIYENDEVNSEINLDLEDEIIKMFSSSYSSFELEIIEKKVKILENSEETVKKIVLAVNEMQGFLKKDKNMLIRSNKELPIICNYLDCKTSTISINTRLTINNLDVNYTTLILFTVLLILITELKKRKHQITLFIVFLSIILYYTKSRLGIVISFTYFMYFFAYKFFTIKNTIAAYIVGNLLVILLAYWMINSLVNPNNEFEAMQLLPDAFLPYHSTPYFNQTTRLAMIFESSVYLKFLHIFKGYWLIINNIELLLLPGNWSILPDHSFQTLNKTLMFIRSNSSFPHNFFSGSVKEFGIICTIILHINIFNFMKYKKFKSILIPILAGSTFLGVQILFVLHLLFMLSFINRSNLLKLRGVKI